MVADHKPDRNEKIRTTTQGVNTCEAGMTVGVSGTRWLLNGRVTKTGPVRDKDATQLKIRKIVTFALRSVKHSTIHRTRIGKKKKETVEGKVPGILGPADVSILTRNEGPTVEMFGDCKIAEK